MWKDINMDFVVGLPQTRKQNESIWVMFDRLTKCSRFIPVNSTYTVKDYARIHMNYIVNLHGISLSIISNRGDQFTSCFSKSFKNRLGTQAKLSTAFHNQMDSQAERTIQKHGVC